MEVGKFRAAASSFFLIFKAFAVLLKNFRALILELQIIDKINFIYGENIRYRVCERKRQVGQFSFC